jgi:hypothetical protein
VSLPTVTKALGTLPLGVKVAEQLELAPVMAVVGLAVAFMRL